MNKQKTTHPITVSVVIPVYNVEQFIERCARSLMEQTLKDIEFIFVNDCTPDNSITLLEAVLKEYPFRITSIVHHSKNKGLAAARKTGLKMAQGKYIVHCDSDDWVEKDMYASMLNVAEQVDADIVACGFKMEDSGSTTDILYPYKIETKQDILNPQMFGWLYGAVWNKMILRDLYLNYNIVPIEGINMWEDSVLTIPLRLHSSKTVIIPKTYYHYWVGKRQSSFFSNNDFSKVDEMVNAVKFLEKYFSENLSNNEYFPLTTKLKLLCKERLMSVPNKRTFLHWKRLFPENDLRIWRVKDYSLITKIKVTLIHILPESLAYWIFCLRKNNANLNQ